MGVQFMQSNSLYSQLLHVGNLLHIGQHEACHNWKQGGGGGYFKHLLIEGEEPSISSQYGNAEDTKPLIVRSLEINGGLIGGGAPMDTSPPPPLKVLDASKEGHQISARAPPLPSPPLSCLESKPSIKSPPPCASMKRARESTHIEGMEGACKKEKKATEEKEKGKKGGQQGPALGGGRKAAGTKTKAPKPAPVEAPRTDYVHVRARRGQATDSHSLAERVRREKISERMRFLQDLVPGCSKISGKALILDEIINYVQSLQNQVEFLAMRLATTHPKLDHSSLNNFMDEEIASPFMEEEAKEHIDMLPKALATQTLTSDTHFESLPQFYSSFFDEANFNTSIVSDLSTSTCNDSNLTNMDFSHLS